MNFYLNILILIPIYNFTSTPPPLKYNQNKKILTRRLFSISQFTFQTMDQYIAIEKELNSNKRRYEQSYEGYFINQDGTLNFQEMIETLDAIISSGEVSINSMLDQSRHRHRVKEIVKHPEKDVYLHLKKNLFNLQIDEEDLKRSILIDEANQVQSDRY